MNSMPPGNPFPQIYVVYFFLSLSLRTAERLHKITEGVEMKVPYLVY